MTKLPKSLFIALAVLLALFLGTAPCLARDEVLYVTVDKLPSGLTGENDNANVIMRTVEAVREELNDCGPTEFLPWARGLHMMAQDRPVAMFPLFRTVEREALYQWAGPIARLEWGLFQLADAKPQINTLEEARATVTAIGIFREDPRGRFLRTLGFSVDEANSSELSVNKLVHGRVKLIVFSKAGLELMKTNPRLAGIKLRLAVEFEPRDFYVAFSMATDPDYVQRWNDAFRKLRQDGTIGRIWHDAGPQELIPPQ